MWELIKDFATNRTTALSVLRGLALGLTGYMATHEAAFPEWAETAAAIITGGLFGVSGQPRS